MRNSPCEASSFFPPHPAISHRKREEKPKERAKIPWESERKESGGSLTVLFFKKKRKKGVRFFVLYYIRLGTIETNPNSSDEQRNSKQFSQRFVFFATWVGGNLSPPAKNPFRQKLFQSRASSPQR